MPRGTNKPQSGAGGAAERGSQPKLVVGESLRERNKRDKLNRIVGAARGLFQTQGFDSTTTQQIAQAARIATGTLFLYAKSKEDLLVLVFINEMREVIAAAEHKLDRNQPPLDQIMTLFGLFIEYHAADAATARLLIRELTFLSNVDRAGEVNEIVAAILELLRGLTVRAVEQGDLNEGVEVDLFARGLFAVYYQQLQTWLSGYVPRRQFERDLRRLLNLIVEPRLMRSPTRDTPRA